MQRVHYVLHSDGMALTVVADYMYNFFVKSHMYLCSILHGIYNSYGLMIDGCKMDIRMVTVKKNTSKPRAACSYLNWKITRQLHILNKGLDV